MSEDVATLDAVELARRVRRRELSPVEIVRCLRERAERLNPELNAFVAPFRDAEERAREAEAAVLRGAEIGALHGVPFTIKDTFDTAGVRTTRGSRLFSEHVPERDAEVVTRLRVAGGIPLAKTNSPEFALWWETGNLVYGTTRNPWEPGRTAGGSSGGEAAAIAAGLSPLGVGSDVGGSVRQPASFCGVVGLKPTHGRVPLTGHFPEILARFMHVGFLARSVRDVALALAVTCGPGGDDPYALPVAPPGPVGDAGLPPLRIGLATEDFGPIADAVEAVVRRAAAALERRGCVVEPVTIPGLGGSDWNVVTMALYGAQSRPYFEELTRGRLDDLHPALRRRLSQPPATLEAYLAAEAEVERLRRDVARFFDANDLLLCPAVPLAAPGHDSAEVHVDGEAHPPRTTLRATIPFDLTGSPALSVPFGADGDGLPVGVQLVGRHYDETTVFRAGIALEQARGPLPLPGP